MNPDDDPLSRRRFVVATAAAVAAAGATGTAAAQEEGGNESGGGGNESGGAGGGGNESGGGGNESGGGNQSGGNESGSGGGGATETVNVVDNAFEPADLAVEPGTTVEWAWQGTQAQHNVVPDSQPEGAGWEGHTSLESGDFSFTSTFDTEGTYEYICEPHVSQGMTGTLTVSTDAGQQASGPVQLVPDAAWTLVIATVAGMVSTLSLVYAFMRFGGSSER
ncbi:plastocyanin/azurin family copper-binding protein [Saliphagus sp. LR7]|uniref:plastocyanin/azurin family copper-binding protein n=1 Tax=Saliphagus sp. LR7 TaxID=2282654 RepID=UPI000DF7D252|nr:plastocyanin/azurin family copper-binding protein [Saliphagus sp. LR7]